MIKCQNCGNDHNGKYASGRFCSDKCSRSFSTKNKRLEINEKIRNKSLSRDSIKNGKKSILQSKRDVKECFFCKELTYNKKYCSNICYRNYHNSIRTSFENYRIKCSFKFNVYDYPDFFDIDMIEKNGWYSATNKGNNINGASRDHLYSIRDGFINNINPDLISHPANCCIKLNLDNQKKWANSEITLDELIIRIEKFNKMTVWPIG